MYVLKESEKMKKKISLVLLCGAMVLGLCGCGNKENNNNNNNYNNSNTNNQSQEISKNDFVLTKKNVIGTWNYMESDGQAKITISEYEIDFGDGRTSQYEIKGNWILLKNDKSIGVVLYAIDKDTMIGLEGISLTR